MQFSTYLRQRVHRPDAIGRLARDYVADSSPNLQCPAIRCRATTYQGIKRHMVSAHRPDACFLEALDAAYAEYQQTNQPSTGGHRHADHRSRPRHAYL